MEQLKSERRRAAKNLAELSLGGLVYSAIWAVVFTIKEGWAVLAANEAEPVSLLVAISATGMVIGLFAAMLFGATSLYHFTTNPKGGNMKGERLNTNYGAELKQVGLSLVFMAISGAIGWTTIDGGLSDESFALVGGYALVTVAWLVLAVHGVAKAFRKHATIRAYNRQLKMGETTTPKT